MVNKVKPGKNMRIKNGQHKRNTSIAMVKVTRRKSVYDKVIPWALVVEIGTVAGAIFGGIGVAQSFLGNRKVKGRHNEVRDYLSALKDRVDTIYIQNLRILEILDDLAKNLKKIVRDAVRVELLEEKYAGIDSIRRQFYGRTRPRPYRLTRNEYVQFHIFLTYLFLHDNRVSKTHNLIEQCEIGSALTNDKAWMGMRSLVKERRNAIEELRKAFGPILETKLLSFERLLNDGNSVVAHNFTRKLPSIEKVKWKMEPHRKKTVTEAHMECHRDPERRGPPVCKPVDGPPKVVWDNAFNDAVDAHEARIKADLKVLKMALSNHAELVGAVRLLDDYIAKADKPKRRKNEEWVSVD